MKSDLLFMPPATSATTAIAFDSPSTWVELPTLGQAYTAGVLVFNVMVDSDPVCRMAFARFFPRANPIQNTVQMRLVSYYYDATNQRVYDRSWPIVNSVPNHLGNVGAWVQDKINALVAASPDNPVGRQHNLLIEVMGVGTMFGARLEMQ